MPPRDNEAPSLTPSEKTSSSSSSTSPQPNDGWSQESIYRFLANSANQNVLQHLQEDLPHFHRQPTLMDLVIQSSGTQNVTALEELRLRVLSGSYTLCHLSSYTPLLKILILDGSGLISLRDIGTGLNHLTVLKVSRCGLTSLDGTFGLTSLEELHACDNHIENLAPCTALENIKSLSFDRNPIKTMSSITMLSFCPKLTKLSLKDTPLSKKQDYRKNVIESLPNLQKLDDLSSAIMNILDVENYKCEDFSDLESLSCSTEISSMTEVSIDFGNSGSSSSKSEIRTPEKHISQDISVEKCNDLVVSIKERPATALGIPKSNPENLTSNIKRPKTSILKPDAEDLICLPDFSGETTISSLTSGSIICGNLGRALAKNRSNNSKRTQKLLESYSMKRFELALKVESATKLISNELPERPIESTDVIDLELGICSNNEAENNKFKTAEALKAVKMWKKAFKSYRKLNK